MTITSDCPFSEQCDTANCHTEYAKAFLLCRRGFPTMYLGTSCTDFLMHFPLDILYFLILHLVLWYILSWFLCKVWITGLFFFFDGYSIVPVLLKKRPLFLYWTAFALLFFKNLYFNNNNNNNNNEKNPIVHGYEVLFLDYFVPLIYMVILTPVPHCVDYYSFRIHLDSGKIKKKL